MDSQQTSVHDLAGRPVGLLAGGGLFSWVLARALHEAGVDLRVYCADVGQVDEGQLGNFKADMASHDIPLYTFDLREEAAVLALEAVRYQAAHQGGYWNTTGALRALLVSQLAPRMVRDGCRVIAHGSVFGGNDHRRFTSYLARFAPEAVAYAPWADETLASRFAGRADMVAYLQREGELPGLAHKTAYSSDGSLMGVSHEGTELESGATPWTEAPFAQTVLPHRAPDEPVRTRIEIAGGEVRRIDGIDGTAAKILGHANALAGKHGIGLACVIEQRIKGTKCRGIYEAPGMTLLGHAFARMCDAALPADVQALHQSLCRHVGRRLYEGRYFDPDTQAAKSTLAGLSAGIDGTLDIELYKGNMFVLALTGQRDDILESRFTHGGHAWH